MLTINEDGMSLTLEDDIKDGLSMSLYIPSAHIRMVGLYKRDELKPFLNGNMDDFYLRMDNSLRSVLSGCKKTIETAIAAKECEDNEEKTSFQRYAMFISEDTTLTFEFDEADWKEFTDYIRFIVNGRQHPQAII